MPSRWLAILKNEVFVVVTLIINDICDWFIVEAGHVGDGGGFVQLYQIEPSCEPPFVGSETCRNFTMSHGTIVAARCHDVPMLHAEATSVFDVVEVWQSQTMSELVTCRPDAIHLAATCSSQFTTHRIGVDDLPAKSNGAFSISTSLCEGQ